MAYNKDREEQHRKVSAEREGGREGGRVGGREGGGWVGAGGREGERVA